MRSLLLALLPFAYAFKSFGVSKMSMSTAAEITKQAIDSNAIMVFSKTFCPYCSRAKNALSELNLKYEVYELDVRSDGDAIQKALLDMTGQRTVPNIFVKGNHVGGCDKTLAAIADGSLQRMLN